MKKVKLLVKKNCQLYFQKISGHSINDSFEKYISNIHTLKKTYQYIQNIKYYNFVLYNDLNLGSRTFLS